MKYLIIGDKGQLGKEFRKVLSNKGIDNLGFDYDFLNVADFDKLYEYINSNKPNFVINCSAFNLVDLAETERESCYATNFTGPQNLTKIGEELKFKLVHFSSDYVFDGKKQDLYIETDATNPLNHYGQTKLLGENACLENSTNLVFRLSWVYGDGVQNFIHKVQTWANNSPVLKIADDEISVPTSVKDIVAATLTSLENNLNGLYHLTNSGYCSRLEWAKKIIEFKNINVEIIPAKTADFNLPANRPGFSAMSSKLLSQTLNINLPDWQESLEKFIKN